MSESSFIRDHFLPHIDLPNPFDLVGLLSTRLEERSSPPITNNGISEIEDLMTETRLQKLYHDRSQLDKLFSIARNSACEPKVRARARVLLLGALTETELPKLFRTEVSTYLWSKCADQKTLKSLVQDALRAGLKCVEGLLILADSHTQLRDVIWRQLLVNCQQTPERERRTDYLEMLLKAHNPNVPSFLELAALSVQHRDTALSILVNEAGGMRSRQATLAQEALMRLARNPDHPEMQTAIWRTMRPSLKFDSALLEVAANVVAKIDRPIIGDSKQLRAVVSREAANGNPLAIELHSIAASHGGPVPRAHFTELLEAATKRRSDPATMPAFLALRRLFQSSETAPHSWDNLFRAFEMLGNRRPEVFLPVMAAMATGQLTLPIGESDSVQLLYCASRNNNMRAMAVLERIADNRNTAAQGALDCLRRLSAGGDNITSDTSREALAALDRIASGNGPNTDKALETLVALAAGGHSIANDVCIASQRALLKIAQRPEQHRKIYEFVVAVLSTGSSNQHLWNLATSLTLKERSLCDQDKLPQQLRAENPAVIALLSRVASGSGDSRHEALRLLAAHAAVPDEIANRCFETGARNLKDSWHGRCAEALATFASQNEGNKQLVWQSMLAARGERTKVHLRELPLLAAVALGRPKLISDLRTNNPQALGLGCATVARNLLTDASWAGPKAGGETALELLALVAANTKEFGRLCPIGLHAARSLQDAGLRKLRADGEGFEDDTLGTDEQQLRALRAASRVFSYCREEQIDAGQSYLFTAMRNILEGAEQPQFLTRDYLEYNPDHEFTERARRPSSQRILDFVHRVHKSRDGRNDPDDKILLAITPMLARLASGCSGNNCAEAAYRALADVRTWKGMNHVRPFIQQMIAVHERCGDRGNGWLGWAIVNAGLHRDWKASERYMIRPVLPVDRYHNRANEPFFDGRTPKPAPITDTIPEVASYFQRRLDICRDSCSENPTATNPLSRARALQELVRTLEHQQALYWGRPKSITSPRDSAMIDALSTASPSTWRHFHNAFTSQLSLDNRGFRSSTAKDVADLALLAASMVSERNVSEEQKTACRRWIEQRMLQIVREASDMSVRRRAFEYFFQFGFAESTGDLGKELTAFAREYIRQNPNDRNFIDQASRIVDNIGQPLPPSVFLRQLGLTTSDARVAKNLERALEKHSPSAVRQALCNLQRWRAASAALKGLMLERSSMDRHCDLRLRTDKVTAEEASRLTTALTRVQQLGRTVSQEITLNDMLQFLAGSPTIDKQGLLRLIADPQFSVRIDGANADLKAIVNSIQEQLEQSRLKGERAIRQLGDSARQGSGFLWWNMNRFNQQQKEAFEKLNEAEQFLRDFTPLYTTFQTESRRTALAATVGEYSELVSRGERRQADELALRVLREHGLMALCLDTPFLYREIFPGGKATSGVAARANRQVLRNEATTTSVSHSVPELGGLTPMPMPIPAISGLESHSTWSANFDAFITQRYLVVPGADPNRSLFPEFRNSAWTDPQPESELGRRHIRLPDVSYSYGREGIWWQALRSLHPDGRRPTPEFAIEAMRTDPRFRPSLETVLRLGPALQQLQELFRIGMTEGNERTTEFTNEVRARALSLKQELEKLGRIDVGKLERQLDVALSWFPPNAPERAELKPLKEFLVSLKTLQKELPPLRADGSYDWARGTSKLAEMFRKIESDRFDATTFSNWLQREGPHLALEVAITAALMVATAGAAAPVAAALRAGTWGARLAYAASRAPRPLAAVMRYAGPRAMASARMAVCMTAGDMTASEIERGVGLRDEGHELFEVLLRDRRWAVNAQGDLVPIAPGQAWINVGERIIESTIINLALMGCGDLLTHRLRTGQLSPEILFRLQLIEQNLSKAPPSVWGRVATVLRENSHAFKDEYFNLLGTVLAQNSVESGLKAEGLDRQLAGIVAGILIAGGHNAAKKFRLRRAINGANAIEHTLPETELTRQLEKLGFTVRTENGKVNLFYGRERLAELKQISVEELNRLLEQDRIQRTERPAQPPQPESGAVDTNSAAAAATRPNTSAPSPDSATAGGPRAAHAAAENVIASMLAQGKLSASTAERLRTAARTGETPEALVELATVYDRCRSDQVIEQLLLMDLPTRRMCQRALCEGLIQPTELASFEALCRDQKVRAILDQLMSALTRSGQELNLSRTNTASAGENSNSTGTGVKETSPSARSTHSRSSFLSNLLQRLGVTRHVSRARSALEALASRNVENVKDKYDLEIDRLASLLERGGTNALDEVARRARPLLENLLDVMLQREFGNDLMNRYPIAYDLVEINPHLHACGAFNNRRFKVEINPRFTDIPGQSATGTAVHETSGHAVDAIRRTAMAENNPREFVKRLAADCLLHAGNGQRRVEKVAGSNAMRFEAAERKRLSEPAVRELRQVVTDILAGADGADVHTIVRRARMVSKEEIQRRTKDSQLLRELGPEAVEREIRGELNHIQSVIHLRLLPESLLRAKPHVRGLVSELSKDPQLANQQGQERAYRRYVEGLSNAVLGQVRMGPFYTFSLDEINARIIQRAVAADRIRRGLAEGSLKDVQDGLDRELMLKALVQAIDAYKRDGTPENLKRAQELVQLLLDPEGTFSKTTSKIQRDQLKRFLSEHGLLAATEPGARAEAGGADHAGRGRSGDPPRMLNAPDNLEVPSASQPTETLTRISAARNADALPQITGAPVTGSQDPSLRNLQNAMARRLVALDWPSALARELSRRLPPDALRAALLGLDSGEPMAVFFGRGEQMRAGQTTGRDEVTNAATVLYFTPEDGYVHILDQVPGKALRPRYTEGDTAFYEQALLLSRENLSRQPAMYAVPRRVYEQVLLQVARQHVIEVMDPDFKTRFFTVVPGREAEIGRLIIAELHHRNYRPITEAASN